MTEARGCPVCEAGGYAGCSACSPVPPPAAPCADEVEVVVVARAFGDALSTRVNMRTYMGDVPNSIIQDAMAEALAALSPLRQAERERAWRDGAEAAAMVAERALEGGWLCPYGRDKPGDATWHHTEADKCPACGKDAANSLFACHDTASGRIAAAIRALAPAPAAEVAG